MQRRTCRFKFGRDLLALGLVLNQLSELILCVRALQQLMVMLRSPQHTLNCKVRSYSVSGFTYLGFVCICHANGAKIIVVSENYQKF